MRKFVWVVAFLFILGFLVVPAFGTGSKYTLLSKEIKDSTKTWSIKVCYPEMQNLPNTPVQTAFNRILKEKVESYLKNFKQEASASTYPIEATWPFDLDYQIKLQNTRLVSLFFKGSSFTGGAHPFPIVFTVLFDLERGKDVSLSGLFKPGSKYLEAISDFCTSDLKKHLPAEEFFPEGIRPIAGNFKCFYVTPTALTVVFPPAQAAPYSAGTQESAIPLGRLAKILDPSGPLGTPLR